MRSAAAPAAGGRGERSRISPAHQASASKAGATAVVLPAPGGATSTALEPARSAARRSGRTAWMGRGVKLHRHASGGWHPYGLSGDGESAWAPAFAGATE